MKKGVFSWIACILIVVVISAIFIAVSVLTHISEKAAERINYLVAVIALVVSLIALWYSVVTYSSIDSVSKITSMENNVLEKENYSVSYFELFRQYMDCKTRQDFTDKLASRIIKPIKSAKTCMEFADALQNCIDQIVLFSFADIGSERYARIIAELQNQLDKKYRRFSHLSNGIQYLFGEYVKIIKCVLDYQQCRYSGKPTKTISMESVRGNMLMNPIAKTVYFDYLGLYYLHKLDKIVPDRPGQTKDRRLIPDLTFNDASDEQRAVFYLKQAEECFLIAHKSCQSDLFWSSFIDYNLTRSRTFLAIIKGADTSNVRGEAEQVIRLREKTCLIYCDDPEMADTYLKDRLMYETRLSRSFLEQFSAPMQQE